MQNINTQTNGNNQGMPSALPTVTGTNVFVGTANTAANPGGGAATADNNDIYGPNITFNSTSARCRHFLTRRCRSHSRPSTTNSFYELDLAVTSSNTVFTGLTVTTGGTYQTTDIATNGFKLWYSPDATFGNGDDVQLQAIAPVASGSNLDFSSGLSQAVNISQAINSGITGRLFLSADIAAAAIDGRTLNLAAPNLANIFVIGNKTGTATAGNNLTIDALAPTVTSITSTTPDGSYGTTGNINVTVNFSEAVTLAGGNMTVNLDTGGTVTIAAFTGTSAAGIYTPATGENSTDLNSTTITLAAGATLKDTVGNNATLTIPAGVSLADSKAIIVDTTAPAVPSITTATETTATLPL